jgi:hypothetical protein
MAVPDAAEVRTTEGSEPPAEMTRRRQVMIGNTPALHLLTAKVCSPLSATLERLCATKRKVGVSV